MLSRSGPDLHQGHTSLLALLPLLMAAMQLALAPSAYPQIQKKVAEAMRVDRAPKLDGTLDDPLWKAAKPISDFLQREPYEGQPPTEKTEVRILYTRSEVYFGIVC